MFGQSSAVGVCGELQCLEPCGHFGHTLNSEEVQTCDGDVLYRSGAEWSPRENGDPWSAT